MLEFLVLRLDKHVMCNFYSLKSLFMDVWQRKLHFSNVITIYWVWGPLTADVRLDLSLSSVMLQRDNLVYHSFVSERNETEDKRSFVCENAVMHMISWCRDCHLTMFDKIFSFGTCPHKRIGTNDKN